MYEGIRKLIL